MKTESDLATKDARSERSKLWARLGELDRYLLQGVCTMEKVRHKSGGGILASVGRLTARPRAYEDLVAAGVVLLIPVDEHTVRDDDQQLDTHRVMPTAIGSRLVRFAHNAGWVDTAKWRS